jgi:valyl-tRNA synthetase
MTLAGSATGVDFAWRDDRVESFRNFANKIWNATRFCLMNSEGASVDPAGGTLVHTRVSAWLSLADRWIISRLNKTAKAVNYALETYQFHEAVQLLYHFFWDDFCDWYIELVKDEITARDAENEGRGDAEAVSVPPAVAGGLTEAQIQARARILTVLEQALRLLHPFMPYLTEELWQKLPGVGSGMHNDAYKSADKTIMLCDFPTGSDALIDEKAEAEMGSVIELISKVRNIRSEMNIKPSERVAIHVAANAELQKTFTENVAQILKLARAEKVVLGDSLEVPKASAKAVLTGGAEIALPLEGLIDFDKERERLKNQLVKLDTELQRLNGQLSNKNFVEKAPAEKVQELKDRQSEIEKQIAVLNNNLDALG